MVSKEELVEAWEMFWHTLRWGVFVLCVWFALMYLLGLILPVIT